MDWEELLQGGISQGLWGGGAWGEGGVTFRREFHWAVIINCPRNQPSPPLQSPDHTLLPYWKEIIWSRDVSTQQWRNIVCMSKREILVLSKREILTDQRSLLSRWKTLSDCHQEDSHREKCRNAKGNLASMKTIKTMPVSRRIVTMTKSTSELTFW